jgi:hypothetical protein
MWFIGVGAIPAGGYLFGELEDLCSSLTAPHLD